MQSNNTATKSTTIHKISLSQNEENRKKSLGMKYIMSFHEINSILQEEKENNKGDIFFPIY